MTDATTNEHLVWTLRRAKDDMAWGYTCEVAADRIEALAAEVQRLTRESEGRRVILEAKGNEATEEWKRAERAEAEVSRMAPVVEALRRGLEELHGNLNHETSYVDSFGRPACRCHTGKLLASVPPSALAEQAPTQPVAPLAAVAAPTQEEAPRVVTPPTTSGLSGNLIVPKSRSQARRFAAQKGEPAPTFDSAEVVRPKPDEGSEPEDTKADNSLISAPSPVAHLERARKMREEKFGYDLEEFDQKEFDSIVAAEFTSVERAAFERAAGIADRWGPESSTAAGIAADIRRAAAGAPEEPAL